jgi:hypothetical protein
VGEGEERWTEIARGSDRKKGEARVIETWRGKERGRERKRRRGRVRGRERQG